jgi:8-oxo-(d)GTP phosphatase
MEGSGWDTVHAAGGIVIRAGGSGAPEVAVIHRPSRDDWGLPKGKLNDGETVQEGALREVREETGLRCELVRLAGHITYIDRRGREKVVAYWLMRPLAGSFQPNDEVDLLCWLPVAEALDVLTYPNDRALIATLDLV